MNPGNISVIGSTGSIGQSTLEVVRNNRDRFKVSALACGKNYELLLQQIREFQPEFVAISDEHGWREVKRELGANVVVECGKEALRHCVGLPTVHTVVIAVVGFLGLEVLLQALQCNKQVALANKESLVAGGALVREALKQSRSVVIPLDSEHSNLYQCLLADNRQKGIRRIILTASGGPFLTLPKEKFPEVTPEQALRHPRWEMGAKISIDSSTLMNKGFEVIEAAWLFGFPAEKIEVVIHPQSIVHGLVEYQDGQLLAGLSETSMHAPIAFALGALCSEKPAEKRGERISSGMSPFDFTKAARLEFARLEEDRFPAVKLCYEVLKEGGTLGAVLNAANEVAVSSFLSREICYSSIVELVRETVFQYSNVFSSDFNEVELADAWGRKRASELKQQL